MKRIVLITTSGAYRGLYQILGTEDQLRDKMQVTNMPEFVSPVDFLDHQGACSLVAVKPRYILYREIITPGPITGSHPTFHPAQL